MIINSGSNDTRTYINSRDISMVAETENQTVSIYLNNGTVVNFDVPFDDVLQKMDKDFKSMAAVYGGNKR